MLAELMTILRNRGPGRVPAGLAAAAFCLAAIVSWPTALQAEPKFADPEVNAYVKALSDFRDRYMSAVAAAKHGDESELKRLDAQFPQLQARAIRLMDKLRPDETQRYTEYVTDCAQAMVDATYGLGPKRSG